MFDGDTTEDQVLRAAMARFADYGYQRTSLNDIAAAAGVSRPTVYTYFKNKAAVLRAVSQGLHDATLTQIEQAFANEADLGGKLQAGFWAWSEPYRGILFGSNHGAELIGAGGTMANDISADARARFQAQLTKLLSKANRDGLIELRGAQLSASQAAEFLILSLNGLSSDETDERRYKQRLATLVRVFLRATQPALAKH